MKTESTIQATTPNELELNVSKLVEEHPELLDAANLDLAGAVTGVCRSVFAVLENLFYSVKDYYFRTG